MSLPKSKVKYLQVFFFLCYGSINKLKLAKMICLVKQRCVNDMTLKYRIDSVNRIMLNGPMTLALLFNSFACLHLKNKNL